MIMVALEQLVNLNQPGVEMAKYQFYLLDTSGKILDHAIEIECDHDDLARAVGCAQTGEHDAVEIWSYQRLVGRVVRPDTCG